MKMNSPRRKIVDAVDFLTDTSDETLVTELDVDGIEEFDDHPFHLYEGKRLDDMVDSIKANGVLTPVIVRERGQKEYQMLAGHNRLNASKLAGIKKIPAVIKRDLTDEEAYIYVIETNLMQRSFSDLYPSEKASVLELRYKKISRQGKRTDIKEALSNLNDCEEDKAIETPLTSRGQLAKEYGLSASTIARLLRINKLITEWKLEVDNDHIKLGTAVDMSYIPIDLQEHIYSECVDLKVVLKPKDVKYLRKQSKDKLLDGKKITKYLLEKLKPDKPKKDYQSIKISSNIYSKYFDEGINKNEVQSIIEKALETYFKE